jgi:hypothetical protein
MTSGPASQLGASAELPTAEASGVFGLVEADARELSLGAYSAGVGREARVEQALGDVVAPSGSPRDDNDRVSIERQALALPTPRLQPFATSEPPTRRVRGTGRLP